MGNTIAAKPIEHQSIQSSFTNMMIAFIHDPDCQTVHLVSGVDDKKSAFILEKHVNKNNGKDIYYEISFFNNSDRTAYYVTLLETKNAHKFSTFFKNISVWNVKKNDKTILEMYEVWKKNCMCGHSIICDSRFSRTLQIVKEALKHLGGRVPCVAWGATPDIIAPQE